MERSFEGWVRVLCAGPLAYVALAAYAIPNISMAAVCGGLAIAFAIWPERLAYGYRKNRPVPFWSKPVSMQKLRSGFGDGSRPACRFPRFPRFSCTPSHPPRLAVVGAAIA